MIDLHTHTFFSDGVLIPSELVYRAKVKGYNVIAITDHGDFSNLDFIIPRIKKISKDLSNQYDITVVPGIELTYVPPKLIGKAVRIARELGARIVVVHGETPAETVPEGTNLAGIVAGADIIAHPGYITENEVKLAKKNNVCLEITTRKGHSITNPYIATLAAKHKTNLVLNTDTHEPENLMTEKKIIETLKICRLSKLDHKIMIENSYNILKRRK